jgi:hypothetical protein
VEPEQLRVATGQQNVYMCAVWDAGSSDWEAVGRGLVAELVALDEQDLIDGVTRDGCGDEPGHARADDDRPDGHAAVTAAI